MSDATERRSRIASLSSMPSPAYVADPERLADSRGRAASQAALNELLEKESLEKLEQAGRYSKAKWKIQVWIKSDRSVHTPLTFTISIWESGKRLHGGGDESAFFCRRNPRAPRPTPPPFGALGRAGGFKREADAEGCGGIISGDLIARGAATCPHCGLRWDTEHIADSVFYRTPVERAADIIAKWFHELGDDCDVFVKFRSEDIRVKMMAQEYGLHIASQLKGLVIYPLSHIQLDIANGSTLESRLKALLLA